MIRFVLMDIEGTTTSIDFVKKILFPYASEHLEDFVRNHMHEPKIIEILDEVKNTVLEEQQQAISNQEAIKRLLHWIETDRKHTALKTLQGYIWKHGYETAQYQGHLYPDVLPVWKQWKEQGIQLGIYSSGSVDAQKLLFGYSEEGDVSPYLSAFFDTKIGHKKEVQSYQNIQKTLAIPAGEILFLSDVEAELDAAQAADMNTIQLVRPGTAPSDQHKTVTSFEAINVHDY